MTTTTSRIGWTTRNLSIAWSAAGNTTHYTSRIPMGTRVALIGQQSGPSRWTVDEFPLDEFPDNSGARWDATHYGIDVPLDAITFDKP